MKGRMPMKRIAHICLILILCCTLLVGCTNGAKAADLMEGVKRQEGVQDLVHGEEYASVFSEL